MKKRHDFIVSLLHISRIEYILLRNVASKLMEANEKPLPDTMDVLDGITNLTPHLLLITLHLK